MQGSNQELEIIINCYSLKQQNGIIRTISTLPLCYAICTTFSAELLPTTLQYYFKGEGLYVSK